MINGTVVSGWCVYLLKDDAGRVRYVGKGRPDRIMTSARARRMSYEIAAVNLPERQALDCEARLIHLIGPERLENGHVPAWPRGPVERSEFALPVPRPVPATTGADIRAFRERHGLTGEQFGKLVEPPLNRFVVGALENGRTISAGMRARLMLAMARAETKGEE